MFFFFSFPSSSFSFVCSLMLVASTSRRWCRRSVIRVYAPFSHQAEAAAEARAAEEARREAAELSRRTTEAERVRVQIEAARAEAAAEARTEAQARRRSGHPPRGPFFPSFFHLLLCVGLGGGGGASSDVLPTACQRAPSQEANRLAAAELAATADGAEKAAADRAAEEAADAAAERFRLR